MSVYAHIETKIATREQIQALPVTGREDVFGVVGNTVFFTRAQEENSNEARPDSYLTMFVSPVDAELVVPPHWHPKSVEYFRVFAGEVDFTVNGVTRSIITPLDGEFLIPRRAVHSIRARPDVHSELAERADPDPVQKMLFLRRLLTKGGQQSELSALQAMRIFYDDGDLDVFPSTGVKILDVVMVYVLGGFFGCFLGFGKLPDHEETKKSQ